MNPYFYSPEHQTLPGVVRVVVPGLPKPVYTNKNLAEQLHALIKKKQIDRAHQLVSWLGGMEFQPGLQ